MALSVSGGEVLLAEDGQKALDIVATSEADIDLIVIDYRMPGMNGDEVIKKLRDGGLTLPILICSGFELSATEVRNMGASAYLGKPYRMRELAAACEALLNAT